MSAPTGPGFVHLEARKPIAVPKSPQRYPRLCLISLPDILSGCKCSMLYLPAEYLNLVILFRARATTSTSPSLASTSSTFSTIAFGRSRSYKSKVDRQGLLQHLGAIRAFDGGASLFQGGEFDECVSLEQARNVKSVLTLHCLKVRKESL